jgi:hypothetical protein
VSSTALELMLFSLYVVILKELFPKYPMKLKIRQHIEIPLDAQKRNSFNYLTKRSRELVQVFGAIRRIRKQHLALFRVTGRTARFMVEKVLKRFTINISVKTE